MIQEVGQVAQQSTNLYGLIAIGLGNLFALLILVVREIFKHRDFRKKNGSILNIETDVTTIKTDVAVIKTKAESQENICQQTRNRYDSAIETNQKLLTEHLLK